jgi:tRNA nucleotidyltransferase (CCA-adding enzyme)
MPTIMQLFPFANDKADNLRVKMKNTIKSFVERTGFHVPYLRSKLLEETL